MLTGIVRKIKIIPSYLYRNFAAPRIYSIRDKKILSRNYEIKNKYAGKRCFIVGSGPSIADTDLSKLKNEYTFVIGEFDKNKQYSALAPKFHIIADSAYFTEGAIEHWTNGFKQKSKDIPPSTVMIINLAAKSFIDKYDLFRSHQVYYVGTQGIFTGNLPLNIDLDQYVPNPKNSVLLCLLAATWMGFTEIYLMGCEHNFLAQPLGPSKSFTFSHSYDYGIPGLETATEETLKKYLTPKELKFTYEMNMISMLQLFRNYRFFYAKARKTHPDLKILNATPNSFLDVFPMVKFEDIKLS